MGRTCFSIQRSAFQSTLPARGATLGARRHGRRPHNFNPRSPHGERPPAVSRNTHPRKFQSTLPARGATRASSVAAVAAGISTHAPRTGSDVRRAINHHASAQFQSTLPARGATQHQHGHGGEKPISIHAPRTGSDRQRTSRAVHRRTFQSTLPARGATPSGQPEYASPQISIHFNPRSPHGERRRGFSEHWREIISIHAPRTGSDVFDEGMRIVGVEFQSTLPARGATLLVQIN